MLSEVGELCGREGDGEWTRGVKVPHGGVRMMNNKRTKIVKKIF